MSQLFEPFKIGPVTFRNRFVRSATQDWLPQPDGQVSEAQLELYEQLAAGGVGLIMTAHSYVSHPLGRAGNPQNAIYHERFIEGYKKMVEVVHRHDAKIFLQLAHAGRQVSRSARLTAPPGDVVARLVGEHVITAHARVALPGR